MGRNQPYSSKTSPPQGSQRNNTFSFQNRNRRLRSPQPGKSNNCWNVGSQDINLTSALEGEARNKTNIFRQDRRKNETHETTDFNEKETIRCPSSEHHRARSFRDHYFSSHKIRGGESSKFSRPPPSLHFEGCTFFLLLWCVFPKTRNGIQGSNICRT